MSEEDTRFSADPPVSGASFDAISRDSGVDLGGGSGGVGLGTRSETRLAGLPPIGRRPSGPALLVREFRS